jgi:hypothetical protein
VRGTFDPGYLNYTLGKLMILKLRDDWKGQEGPRYSLQRFHDELLRHGAPPLPLLRKRHDQRPEFTARNTVRTARESQRLRKKLFHVTSNVRCLYCAAL